MEMAHNPEPWSHSAPFMHGEIGNIAVNLYEGRGFSSPFSKGATPTAWECPLVPVLWASAMACVHGATGYTARLLVYLDAIASALSVMTYWLIARHICRKSAGFTRVTSVLVAAIFCLWPESLFGLQDLWYYQWQELGTALLILLAMRWIDRPGLLTVLPLALVGGCLALINVTPIPIFAVALLLPLPGSEVNRKQILRGTAVGTFVAFLIVLPWLTRNAMVLGAFVPFRSNAGYQLWEGNNPNGCIRETEHSPHPAILSEESRRYQKLGEVEYCSQGLHNGLAYIRAHPLKTILRTGQRAYVMWFSDSLDQWSWDGSKWWEQDMRVKYRALCVTLSAWGTVIVLVWALAYKRLASLPYKSLFISLAFFLPFPYYFTLAGQEYSQILRAWLLILSILAFQPTFSRHVDHHRVEGK